MNSIPALDCLRNITPFRAPVELAWFVTDRCNFSCGHCFNPHTRKDASSEGLLSLADMERFARTLPDLWSLLLTGGEPFLRTDLADICRMFHRRCRVRFIAIPTNASLPEAVGRMVPEIMRACPDAFVNISPSLDHIGSRRDEWTGFPGSFDRFLETCRRLTELMRRHPRLSMNVITTFHRGNQEDIFDILRFVTDSLKAPSASVNLVRGPTADNRSDRNLDLNRYARAAALAEAHTLKHRAFRFHGRTVFLHLRRAVRKAVLNTCADPSYRLPCLSGQVRMVVSSDGRIAPCEPYLLHRPDADWGRLEDHGFDYRRLARSDRRLASLRRIRRVRCHCRSECDLFYTILFHPVRFARLLTEPLFVNRSE